MCARRVSEQQVGNDEVAVNDVVSWHMAYLAALASRRAVQIAENA